MNLSRSRLDASAQWRSSMTIEQRPIAVAIRPNSSSTALNRRRRSTSVGGRLSTAGGGWISGTRRASADPRGLTRPEAAKFRPPEEESPEDLDERSKRHGHGPRLEAVAASDQGSASARRRCEFDGKARFADTGLATEEHEARLAQHSRVEAGLQLGTLGNPADEDRARDATNHRADHDPEPPELQRPAVDIACHTKQGVPAGTGCIGQNLRRTGT